MEFLGRAGLLVCAVVMVWLARRWHSKARNRGMKIVATVMNLVAGLAFMGTIVGDWMGRISSASPYIAAAMFLFAVGGLVGDWVADKQPDKLAFWCALFVPLAVVFGMAQVRNLGDEIGRSADRVSSSVEQSTGR